MQIHELNNFTGTLGSGSFLAVDNGTDTGKLSTQQLLAATEARIDNIIAGPAPSAEEIVDARLGADGVPYPSLGDAIRDQFTDVKSAINDITLREFPYKTSLNITTASGYQRINLWQNAYQILRADYPYKLKLIKNDSGTGAVNVHISTGADPILHVEQGQTTDECYLSLSAETGLIYYYANEAGQSVTFEIYKSEYETSCSYTFDAPPASHPFCACEFPFKKQHRYEVEIAFSSATIVTDFGLSLNSTYYWSNAYTPIVKADYAGFGLTRRFISNNDYNYLILSLSNMSAETLTVNITDLGIAENFDAIVVAAGDSSTEEKLTSDFVCNGANDEYVINMAIMQASWGRVGTVLLKNGTYHIQSFPKTQNGKKVAIQLINNAQEVNLIGQNCPYGFCGSLYGNGVTLYVDYTGYFSLGQDEEASVIRTPGGHAILSGNAINIKNIGIHTYGSQRKITCVDLLSGDRVYCEKMLLLGYGHELRTDPDVGLTKPPTAIPVNGFTGFQMGTGSNDPQGYTLRNIGVWGFYEAFKVGGEHLLMEQCAATIGVYGYTFGNFDYGSNPNTIVHPITMINCCDERNQNFPLFKKSGWNQQITMIDFNLEQVTDKTPGGVFNNYMTDETGGRVRGEITYTIMTAWGASESGGNVVDKKLWADGSGIGFITQNAAQKHMGTTAERLTYEPNYHQQYFDTTLNKLLICTDPSTKTWVDANGNAV